MLCVLSYVKVGVLDMKENIFTDTASSTENTDAFFMGIALEEAKKAYEKGEVPVGAVVVCNGEIVSRAHNTRETEKNALHHAELKAIDLACQDLGGWRLHKCDLYVTLEPCPMCAGATVNARIKRVILMMRL